MVFPKGISSVQYIRRKKNNWVKAIRRKLCFRLLLCSLEQAEKKIPSLSPTSPPDSRGGIIGKSFTQRSRINSDKSIIKITITLIFFKFRKHSKKTFLHTNECVDNSMISAKTCQTNRSRLYLSHSVLMLTLSFIHNCRRNTMYLQQAVFRWIVFHCPLCRDIR